MGLADTNPISSPCIDIEDVYSLFLSSAEQLLASPPDIGIRRKNGGFPFLFRAALPLSPPDHCETLEDRRLTSAPFLFLFAFTPFPCRS